MKTHALCRDCFRRQAEKVIELTSADLGLRAAAEQVIAAMDPELTPPENAVFLYGRLAKLSGNADPFAELKKRSNDLALGLLPRLRRMVAAADDPLAMAVHFALAGNIIDYGAQQDFDLDRALAACLARPPAIDHLPRLRARLAGARRVLYLADNAGELVFDRLLIEQLPKSTRVTLAVKAGAIINDATLADAEACGLCGICRVLDNGAALPGTVLDQCGREFAEEFSGAEVVISKGQGNFETLSEEGREVFHLLTVKCPVVAGCVAEKSGGGAIPLGATVVLRLGR